MSVKLPFARGRRRLLRRSGLLSVFLLLSVLVNAHTVELRALLNPDGSATFYARTYHGTEELLSGGFIVDGVTYPFTGVIQASALPAGTIEISTCTYPFSNYDNFQYVTVPNFNSCITHTFNCTSNSPETPYCNLTSTLNLGAPQVVLQAALANGKACLGGKAELSLSATGNNLTYQWQLDSGSGYADITDGAVYSGAQTAALTIETVTADMTSNKLRCIITGTDACDNASSTTSNEVLLNPEATPEITDHPEDVISCSGSAAVFSVTAAGANLTYQWQKSIDGGQTWSDILGATGSSVNVGQVTSAQNGHQYRALVSGGCGASTSNSASINPFSGFTINNDEQCLLNNNFIFSNHSAIGGGATMSYRWSFGDGSFSTAINPVHHFENVGSYDVKLVVTSSNGCKDSVTHTLNVTAMPSASFAVNTLEQCVKGNSFEFSSPVAAFGAQPAFSYHWDFADGTSSSDANPVKTYSQPGYYKVVLTLTTASGCSDTAVTVVRVNAESTGFILPPATTVICEGADVKLQASGGSSYRWFLNGNALIGNTAAVLAATSAGTYSVEIENEFGCKSNSQNTIALSLVAKPEADFSSQKNCEDVPVLFTNKTTGDGPMNFAWSFGDNVNTTAHQSAHTYAEAGTYTVQLVSTPVACPSLADTAVQTINIEKVIKGTRLEARNAVVNQPLALEARTYDVQYSWRPAAGLNNASIRNPQATLQNEQTFFIDMKSASGCVTTDTLLVRMFKNNDVFVPTGFTPDGDGKNDVFRVILVEAKQLGSLKVFNRRGNLVFSANDASQGWDGTWNGTKQPNDTYLWTCEVIDIHGKKIRKSGSVTLIR